LTTDNWVTHSPFPTPLTLSSTYDLIIIGDTAAARQATKMAATSPARVAWIIPPAIADSEVHPHGDWYPLALARMAETAQPEISIGYYWQAALGAIDRLSLQSAPALLAVAGVDTIAGMPEFFRLPHLGVRVGNRNIQARSYVVATGSMSPDVNIPGLTETGYVSIETLPLVAKEKVVPQHWAIVGTESIGVELAQTLARLGHDVVIIIEGNRLLPQEDLAVAYQIQMLLEAEGVHIYFDRSITAVRAATGKKIVFMGDETIAVDEIFVALPDCPWIDSFNLAGVGIDYDDRGILVNDRLQTTNPNIYACGSVCGSFIGGYHGDRLTRSEARIATHNALWRQKQTLDRLDIPYTIDVNPPLARVGLTGVDMGDRENVMILKQEYRDCERLSIAGEIDGWCQIAVTQRGEILGATIWGDRSPELIEIVTMAMRDGVKIDRLAMMDGMSPTHAEIIYQTARQWLEHRKPSRWRQKLWLWFARRF
jgi:pyruvate/2-oxoglutarate dehydrogenase complex dihydrolipoamide dehydrogenase (E3) component